MENHLRITTLYIPGGERGNSLQYSCLENPHGQRSLVGYSPWDRKESDRTEWLSIVQHSEVSETSSVFTQKRWADPLPQPTLRPQEGLDQEGQGPLIEMFSETSTPSTQSSHKRAPPTGQSLCWHGGYHKDTAKSQPTSHLLVGRPREQTSTLMSGGPITEENKAGQRKERDLRASLSRETSEMRQLTLGEVFQAKALRL